MHRSWLVQIKIRQPWKYPEAKEDFRVIHQSLIVTDRHLTTAGKGCDLGCADPLGAIPIEICKLAAAEPASQP